MKLRSLFALLILTSVAVSPVWPHLPRFVRELPFYYDLYTFRGGAPGKTAVVAAFAVPATELEKSVDDKGVHYRFDVSLILADTAQSTSTAGMR